MEKIDLSTYARDIKQHYDAVVSGDKTYAIFKTLKDSSLKPIVSGDGDIQEFVSEFEEGSVQFGIMGVNPFGSDVKKLLLLGWCPDSAPIKSKVSYAQNLSAVGKVLHYHVEITARDSDDLDVDDIMKTVSNASGARYSIQSLTPQKSSISTFKPKPKAATTTPVATLAPTSSTPSVIKPKPSLPPKKAYTSESNDGWGDEAEIKERDFSKEPLANVPSAYKPTKVDIHALRTSKPESSVQREEPKEEKEEELPKTKTISINPSGGLTSLPKPKPSHSVLSRFNQSEVVKPDFGTKAPVFDSNPGKDSSKLIGGLSRNFGAENGKTPAQLWAEKKGQYKEVPKDDRPVNAEDVEKDIDHEDISLNSAREKFETLHLQAKREEEEEETQKPVSSFPPPPARSEPVKSTPVSSFPPPHTRDTLSKSQKEDESKNDEAWGEEENKPTSSSFPPAASSTPAVLPSRPIPLVTEPEEEKPASAVVPPTTGKQAVAEYEYEKDEDNEIGFAEGETITAIEFVDEDWWKGTNSKGETGLFPASYVSIVEVSSSPAVTTASAPPPSLPSRSEPAPAEEIKPSGPCAVAEYDYDATEDNELTFVEGDVITDIDKVDEDWWLGSLNGQRKLFPANYVTLQ